LVPGTHRLRGYPDIHQIPNVVVEHFSPEDNRRGLVALASEGNAKGLGGGKAHTKKYETRRQDDPDTGSHSIT
jgi:hypothetical protein